MSEVHSTYLESLPTIIHNEAGLMDRLGRCSRSGFDYSLLF